MAKGKKGQRPVRCLSATRWRGIKAGSCGVSDFAARVGVKVVKRKGPSLGMEVQRMKLAKMRRWKGMCVFGVQEMRDKTDDEDDDNVV